MPRRQYSLRMDVDLGWLRAFTTVAQELHFGRAALRLGISQPQVSRQVRALEQALGVQLFVRTARRTELSDAGAALLEDAREILTAAQRLHGKAAAQRRGVRGHVSVAFLWSTLGGYLAPLVAGAATHQPEIELSVSQITYLELIPALRRGDIDLAITRPIHERSEMIEVELETRAGDDRSSSRAPLRRSRRGRDRAAQRATADLTEPQTRAERVRRRDPARQRRGIELNIVRDVRSASEALALVSAGLGSYRLPSSAATPFPGVVFRPLSGTESRLVLLHRPFPRPSVTRIAELATTLFGDAGSASKDAADGLGRDRRDALAFAHVTERLSRGLKSSPRVRALQLLWRASPLQFIAAVVFIVAEGALPVLVLVLMGRVVAAIPAAVLNGISSPTATSCWSSSPRPAAPMRSRCCAAPPRMR